MIDMKLNQDQSPTLLGASAGEHDGPQYPYGLRITLDGETLKRLAIGEGNLPQVGKRLALKGLAEVVEVCKEQGQTRAEYCVELQITTLELSEPEALNPQQEAMRRVEAMFAPV